MDLATVIGIIGWVLLVIGAAYPREKVVANAKSVKNWLFSIGSWLLLVYALMGYLAGGPVLLLGVEVMIVLGCIMMLLDIKPMMARWIVSILWVILLVRAFTSLWGIDTMMLFILGGAALGLGYVSPMESLWRNLALTIGGILAIIFSYLGASRILFWLNVGFAAFCLYSTILNLKHAKK